MINLKLIKGQPRWRVALAHLFCRAIGVMVKVEGIPFGSSRNTKLFPMTGVNAAQNSSWRQNNGHAALGRMP